MDWSIALGIAGIVVSVVVGWLTYVLANRRARTQRWLQAKTAVLQGLSKSLGEDAIPSIGVLRATIRSVLREIGDPKLELSLDEVLDDLIRQVTADPFLDVERRRQLQAGIEKVRLDDRREARVPARSSEYQSRLFLRSTSAAALTGLLAAVATALASLFAASEKSGALDSVLSELRSKPALILLGVLGLSPGTGSDVLRLSLASDSRHVPAQSSEASG